MTFSGHILTPSIRALSTIAAFLAIISLSNTASAQLEFRFEEVGGDVVMTPSGSIDTALLTPANSETFGGVGFESNSSPESDILGDDTLGDPDTGFRFSDGTDFSAWTDDPGPLSSSYFGWTSTISSPFNTYVRNPNRLPGLQVRAADLVGSVFTLSGTWTATGETFASTNLIPGTYTVTDASTGAFISIIVGDAPPAPAPGASVPVPATPLWALGLLALLLGGLGYRKMRS